MRINRVRFGMRGKLASSQVESGVIRGPEPEPEPEPEPVPEPEPEHALAVTVAVTVAE